MVVMAAIYGNSVGSQNGYETGYAAGFEDGCLSYPFIKNGIEITNDVRDIISARRAGGCGDDEYRLIIK